MDQTLTAIAFVNIDASRAKVWKALTDPDAIREYMFGAAVATDWKEGRPILWKGEWEGRPYADHGMITAFQPERRLGFTHFSPRSGAEDKPENYHNITIELKSENSSTHVTLSQGNNATREDQARYEKNWKTILESLKAYIENQAAIEAERRLKIS